MMGFKDMQKETKILLCVLALVIIVVIALNAKFNFLTVFLEDYTLYGEGLPLTTCPTGTYHQNCPGYDYPSCSITPQWVVSYTNICLPIGPGGTEDKVVISSAYPAALSGGSWQQIGSQIETTQGFKGKNVRADLLLKSKDGGSCASSSPSMCTGNGATGFVMFIDGTIILQESVPAGGSSSGLLELVPSLTDRNVWDVVWKGQIVKSVSVTGDGKIGFKIEMNSADLTINNFRWKPLFNCQVETDEAVIADEFAPGTTFGIGDLTYPPVKFCLDSYPAVVRSMTEQGVASDVKGEITRALARGEKITVKPGETIMVSYIADFVEGMMPRCNIGQVYNTKTAKCQKLIEELPDAPNIVSNVTVIYTTTNDALLPTLGTWGDAKIEMNNVQYLCGALPEFKNNNFDAPNPRSDCWTTSVRTPSQNYDNVKHGQVLLPMQYYSVAPIITAKWDSDCDNCPNAAECASAYGCVKGIGSVLFKWLDHSAINAESVTQPWEVSHGTTGATMKVRLTNNFDVNFVGKQSGFRVTKENDLIQGETRYDVFVPFKKGTGDYAVPLDTTMLGEIRYELVPFVSIGGVDGTQTTLFDDQKVTYTFFITGEGITPPSGCPTPCPTGQQLKTDCSCGAIPVTGCEMKCPADYYQLADCSCQQAQVCTNKCPLTQQQLLDCSCLDNSKPADYTIVIIVILALAIIAVIVMIYHAKGGRKF